MYSIKCPICFDFYDKDKKPFETFLCGHCYCIKCLEEMQKYLDEESDMIRCPTCNIPTMYYVKLYFNITAADEKENVKKPQTDQEDETLIIRL